MPTRAKKKDPTGPPWTQTQRAAYWFGLHVADADRMPERNSEHLVEWLLLEVGRPALSWASHLGWQNVWWWIDRGRNEREPGKPLVAWSAVKTREIGAD